MAIHRQISPEYEGNDQVLKTNSTYRSLTHADIDYNRARGSLIME